MFNLLRKSLSGDKEEKQHTEPEVEQDYQHVDLRVDSIDLHESGSDMDSRTSKRNRSGDHDILDGSTGKSKKKKRLSRSKRISDSPASVCSDQSEQSVEEPDIIKLPAETPEWGLALVKLIQAELKSVRTEVRIVETNNTKISDDVKSLERKLHKVENRNRHLELENSTLKEKMLDLDYKQRLNNLIFDGIPDSNAETDIECIGKLRNCLRHIDNFDANGFRIDKCFRLDGSFRETRCRRVLCTFNWYRDAQTILRNRKSLPKGVYVQEDLPEPWSDRRKVLKPIFNAAKRVEKLKKSTYFTKDKLVIDGKVFSTENYTDANAMLDLAATCQRKDNDKLIFLGMHSVYSNFHPAGFTLNNIKYSSAEQFIQSEKAALFNDDITQAKILSEHNPYKIKKLGAKVRGFREAKWSDSAKSIVFKAVSAKFNQNPALAGILVNSGDMLLAKGSIDSFWGTGRHLRDKRALDKRAWENEGGAMSEILHRVRTDLKKNLDTQRPPSK